MKTPYLQIILALFLAPVCFAATNEFWFPVGEKLMYRLYWGVIPVGTCEITTQWAEYKGREMLALRASAKTTSVVDKIYPVDDFIESLVDPVTFLPCQYTQKLHEGRHIRSDLITFAHAQELATWQSGKADETNETKEIKIDADTRDVLCLAYFMRAKGLAVGDSQKFRVLVDDTLYGLEVAGLGYEDMKVATVGKIKCLVVEPKAKFGQIFVKKGRVSLWFSEDTRRLCTRMEGKLAVANLKAILTKVSGPGNDVWVAKDSAKESDGEVKERPEVVQ